MVSVALEKQKVLFVHLPKTGGGSISRVLRREANAIIYPVQAMSQAEPCITQLSRQLAKPLSSYRTVAFVRNPWDWTVSGYLHVTQNKPAYEKPPSFRDFVMGAWEGATILQYPNKFTSPGAYVAYHTQISQWAHLFANSRADGIDVICKFETLEQDAKTALGIRIELPHINRSNRDHYSDYYDDETKDLVATRNAPLIDRFGYRFNEGTHRESRHGVTWKLKSERARQTG